MNAALASTSPIEPTPPFAHAPEGAVAESGACFFDLVQNDQGLAALSSSYAPTPQSRGARSSNAALLTSAAAFGSNAASSTAARVTLQVGATHEKSIVTRPSSTSS